MTFKSRQLVCDRTEFDPIDNVKSVGSWKRRKEHKKIEARPSISIWACPMQRICQEKNKAFLFRSPKVKYDHEYQ